MSWITPRLDKFDFQDETAGSLLLHSGWTLRTGVRRGRRSWATRSENVDAGHVLIGLMLVMLFIVSMLVMFLVLYMWRKAETWAVKRLAIWRQDENTQKDVFPNHNSLYYRRSTGSALWTPPPSTRTPSKRATPTEPWFWNPNTPHPKPGFLRRKPAKPQNPAPWTSKPASSRNPWKLAEGKKGTLEVGKKDPNLPHILAVSRMNCHAIITQLSFARKCVMIELSLQDHHMITSRCYKKRWIVFCCLYLSI